MKLRDHTKRAAVSLGGLVLASLLTACVTAKPAAVTNLEARAAQGSLVVTWQNPVDFERVRLQITDPKSKAVPTNRISGFATKSGLARAVLLDAEPGNYTVQVYSNVAAKGAVSERGSEVVACEVPVPVSGGYVTMNDLGFRAKEPLDVVVMIHPRCGSSEKRAPKDSRAQLFRQMAGGVLSEVFRSVIQVNTQDQVIQVEDYRTAITKQLGDSSWPLAPDALIIVDVRDAEGDVPGQLSLRVHDLKLGTGIGRTTDDMARDLYNQRPLVLEQFEIVPGNPKDLGQALLTYRDAWRKLLAAGLRHPRYLQYREWLGMLREQPERFARSKDAVQVFMFNELPAAFRSIPSEGDNVDVMKTEFTRRTKIVEERLLFGPGVAGPLTSTPRPVPKAADGAKSGKNDSTGRSAPRKVPQP